MSLAVGSSLAMLSRILILSIVSVGALRLPTLSQCSSRRDMVGQMLQVGAAVAVTAAAPEAAFAASSSPQSQLKSRAVYGSRVFRLQNASPEFILEEKNAFTLFITGVYSATADKPVRVKLEKLEKTALAAAKKGDAAGAQAAIKEFVQLTGIIEYDTVPGNVFNQKSACDRQGLQCGYGYEGYIGSRNKD